MKSNLLFINCPQLIAQKIQKQLQELPELTITGFSNSPTETLTYLSKSDIQLVGLYLSDDMSTTISSIKAFNDTIRVLVMGEQTAIDSVKRAISNGADDYVAIGVGLANLIDKIYDYISPSFAPPMVNNSLTVNISKERAMDERLANIFISSGIPPHIKGYQFLREAVKQSVNNPDMINNITKQLYPAVATRFSTSPTKVERAIRHAIEVAWGRGKIDNINSIYGVKVISKGEKPTNGELIALVSDKMIIECS